MTRPDAAELAVDVIVQDGRWETVPHTEDMVVRAARAAAAGAPAPAELAVLLADDAALRDLNLHWRGKDRPTNVLSFPPGAEARARGHLGDIALAYETLAREAASEGKPVAHHLQHLVVHGVLHLLGMDHETAAAAEEMEARERAILAHLGVPDPYAAAATGA